MNHNKNILKRKIKYNIINNRGIGMKSLINGQKNKR